MVMTLLFVILPDDASNRMPRKRSSPPKQPYASVNEVLMHGFVPLSDDYGFWKSYVTVLFAWLFAVFMFLPIVKASTQPLKTSGVDASPCATWTPPWFPSTLMMAAFGCCAM